MKFSEAVQKYAEWKKENKGTSVLTSKEIANIRKAYKEGKISEKKKDIVEQYREWKTKNKGSSIVSMKEKNSLKKYENKLLEEKNTPEKKDIVEQYREWKAKNKGSSIVSMKEKRALQEMVKEDNNDIIEKYREWKKANKGSSIVTPKERKLLKEKTILMGTMTPPQELEDNAKTFLVESIREARKHVFMANKALKENDMMAAADNVSAAGDVINSADATMATESCPPNIVNAIANLKTTIDDLAVQCGIESPVDLGADPAAGVPPVDGTAQPATPEQQQPVMEGNKIDDVKARLAKREVILKSMAEGKTGQDYMAAAMEALTIPRTEPFVDKSNDEEQIKTSTAKSKEAGDTWPTKPIKTPKKESITDKMINERIQENTERWDFKKILESGILG